MSDDIEQLVRDFLTDEGFNSDDVGEIAIDHLINICNQAAIEACTERCVQVYEQLTEDYYTARNVTARAIRKAGLNTDKEGE